ncbi:complement regulator-acquiring protein [Borreliella carolinensis]|uniref:complement regulator-acquiring protein n=1 Tax=Borreliella carolinensis TaxID=478174 RepID=UPI00294203C0|nr:complement regulator-acquiring protein [Borreliella carolinensis]WNY65491.1 complement regulator-acquiring protein [Borreliella carolinensis]
MKNANPNIIKLNIITMILTLIFISCMPLNKIDPKANETINPKNNQNPEDASGGLGLYDQKSKKDIISELKKIGKYLEDQKNVYQKEIAIITAGKFDFLETFIPTIVPNILLFSEENIAKMKMTLYSSLHYKKEYINTLKEILEKLNQDPEHKIILTRFSNLFLSRIQGKLNRNLESIQKGVDSLDLKEAKSLLTKINSNLNLKESFQKTLNYTMEAYNKNTDNIKSDVNKLAEHFDTYYEGFGSLMPIS